MFILHKGNNCTQRSLLNLNEQANYAALFFLPTAFFAVTKLHTKTRAFPQGAGFICSNLCALLRWNLEDVGLQVALPFPQGRAWGIVASFALSLQVCSTSPWPFQRLKTAKQTTAKPALLLAGFVQTISAALCPTRELPLPALPCSHPAPCSVHPGLCCPARYFHAILPATVARAPLEHLSQKLHLQWEQMPHQAFTYKKETDFVSSFSFETQFLLLSCSSTFSHTRALSADEISDISSDTFWISINKKGWAIQGI